MVSRSENTSLASAASGADGAGIEGQVPGHSGRTRHGRVAAFAAAGRLAQRIERPEPQHMPRVDVVRRAEEPFDLGDAETLGTLRAGAAASAAGPRAGAGRSHRAAAPGRSSCCPRAFAASLTSLPRNASSRCTSRDGVTGLPPMRSDQATITSALPIAMRKSCAARPCRRSGGSRPTASRMPRLSQGPGSAASGQTSSLSPARIMRSGDWRRASSRPQMKTSSRRGTGLRHV